RARAERVHVVKELAKAGTPSTKTAVETLKSVVGTRNALIVIERGDDASALSLRNIAAAHVLYVDQLNTYDVLVNDDVVFTEGALAAFVAGPASGKGATAVA